MTTTTAKIIPTTAKLRRHRPADVLLERRALHGWKRATSAWIDRGGDNHGWKLTLSQNIAIGMGPEFRPMLRFYVTGGRWTMSIPRR